MATPVMTKPMSKQTRAMVQKAKPTVQKAAREVILVPIRVPGAACRGAARTGRAGARWFMQHEFMESSRAAGTWHKDADHHRDRIKQNAKITMVSGGALVLGGWYVWNNYPEWIGPSLAALFICWVLLGWSKKDAKQTRKAPGLLGISREELNDVFLKAGVHKKDEEVDLVTWPHRDGRGVSLTVDLAPGRTAVDAIKSKGSIASWLKLQETGLVLSQVYGKEGHAGRLHIWGMRGDPFADGFGKHPALHAQQWNVWRGAPFGRDAQSREIPLRLIGNHMLIGASPNAGKSYAGRCAAVPFILDPLTKLYIADGKGSRTWAAAARCAEHYISDALDPDAAAMRLIQMLNGCIAEMRLRNATKIQGAELNEMRSRDAADPLPLMLIIVDELQEFTGNTAPDPDSNVKGQTLGKTVTERLTTIGKLYRSAGAILLLLTQRPSKESMSTDLRAVLLTRFALRTRDRWTSDMILGPEFSSRGYCTASDEGGASLLQGVGILANDSDDAPDAVKGYPTLRTYEVSDADWDAACARGAALRGRDALSDAPGDAAMHGRDAGPEGDEDGWDAGGPGDAPDEPVLPPTGTTGPGAELHSDALPDNVIRLKDYLLTRAETKSFSTDFLSKVLDCSPDEVREMFREVGLTPTQVWVREQGPERHQLRGYHRTSMLSAIDRMAGDSAA